MTERPRRAARSRTIVNGGGMYEAPDDRPEWLRDVDGGMPSDHPLQTFAASTLAGVPVPEREWHVEALIPSGTVTLLNGDGGTGKSLIAVQLAASTALGRSWIGHEVAEGPALFLTAEDDKAELHRRLERVAQSLNADLADLDRLHLLSLAGEDALLATNPPGSNVIAPTALYRELNGWIVAHQPALIVLDTLADLLGGNENDRAQARQFIQLLRGIAIRHQTTVLLLAHPSLTGLSSGSGSSGSTAWSNSVRSRLYLERISEEGYEANPDARRLVTKKANYGRTGGEIGLTWQAGVFVADRPEDGLDRMAASSKAERVFLKLLRTFTAQGRFVSAAPSNTFAPSVFAAHPDAEGVTKRAFRSAMENLLSAGRIAIAEHGTGAKARRHLAECDV